jgi:16S rRNA (cytosine967-C5)-methyltransferase
VLRHQRELDTALELDRTDPRLHDVLRLGAYQLRWLTRVPSHAAVSTSVDLARETVGEASTGYVNQALRKLAGAGAWGLGPGGAKQSHPEWLVQRWQSRFGKTETQRLLDWNDSQPVLTLQPARASTDTLARQLRAGGMQVTDAPFGAGLQIRTAQAPGPKPQALPGFAEGAFIVQDPAHALIARFAAIQPSAQVYDACAAPGGKAVALEARGARIIAGDGRHERMGRLAGTTRRAGVAIRCIAANLEAAPLRPASIDAVLVDAPCTATGTMRRHPDARWRLQPAVFTRAAARQRQMLAAAAPLVRPGGVGLLIYATCSLEPEENEQVLESFLNEHPEFTRSARSDAVPAELLTAAGDFRSLPQRHGIDGAYAARLVRVS